VDGEVQSTPAGEGRPAGSPGSFLQGGQ
jgi:hypothetical protein